MQILLGKNPISSHRNSFCLVLIAINFLVSSGTSKLFSLLIKSMQVYERDRYENWDEYEDDAEEHDEEGGTEDGYEEPQKPTKEELDYLELRQKLKDRIRRKLKKELGGSGPVNKTSGFRKDSYGSFFGPSQPVIAQRVIEESKTLLENPQLAAKIFRPKSTTNNKSNAPAQFKPKPHHKHPAPPVNGLRKKAEILKQTRDYSFLQSSDAKFSHTAKNPLSTNSLPTKADARYAQVLPGRKPPTSVSGSGRGITNSSHGQKLVPGSINSKPKAVLDKISNSSVGARKQLGSNHATGHVLPGRSKDGFAIKHADSPVGKLAPSTTKKALGVVPKPNAYIPPSGVRKPVQASVQSNNRSTVSNGKPSAPNRPLVPRREYHGTSAPNGNTKHAPHPSKHQHNRPPPPSARGSFPDKLPKPKPKSPLDDDAESDGEGGRAISMIRKMFGYNPNRFQDDDDDSDMEANFDDIMREERKSAKIARQEDEEQLRMIEEEERRERAKKRKLSR